MWRRKKSVSADVQFDQLTGLWRKEALVAELAECPVYAVAYINIDNFIMINDAAGHRAGDQVLVEIANRLRESVGAKAGSHLCRYGGGEYLVVTNRLSDMNAARIDEILREPFEAWDSMSSSRVMIEFSDRPLIGVAQHPGDGGSLVEAASAAKDRLYEAKRSFILEDPKGGEPLINGLRWSDFLNNAAS